MYDFVLHDLPLPFYRTASEELPQLPFFQEEFLVLGSAWADTLRASHECMIE